MKEIFSSRRINMSNLCEVGVPEENEETDENLFPKKE